MSWIELVAQRRPPQVPEGMQPPENSGDWYRIENSAEDADATDVYVYDSIGGWFGTTADDFIRDMREISTKNINLRLNSPGGSVFEGIAIANTIRNHPSNVTVYVDGLAASIASVIALAGDRLVMMPQSQMMIHDASGVCYGNAADMEYMVGLLNKQSDNIADAYADRAGGTAAEWRDLMRDETWYSAKEAVAAGLADEVREKPAATTEDALAAKMQSVWDLTAYRYAGREKAPVPKLAASAKPVVELMIGGHMVPIADDLASSLLRIVPTPAAEPVAVVEEPAEDTEPAAADAESDSSLLDAIRDVIRAEFAELRAALPPFLKPDEETEDAVEEEVDDASEEEVEDADKKEKKKKLPPWLKPDEDEDDDTEDSSEESTTEAAASTAVGDGAPPSEHPAETGLGNAGDTVESQETYDEAFSGLIAHLMSPSPSADDVFNRLKEAL